MKVEIISYPNFKCGDIIVVTRSPHKADSGYGGTGDVGIFGGREYNDLFFPRTNTYTGDLESFRGRKLKKGEKVIFTQE